MKPSDARPLIAVTTSEVRRSEAIKPTPEGEPPQREMALGLPYLQALETAGAIPIVTPPLAGELAESLLTRVDGVCLSGGPDLDPGAYGELRHARTGPVESELDAFELAIARAADREGLPILAICRGMQVLNVARGGTLHQHLPDVSAGDVEHRQSAPGTRTTHLVTLRESSRIARILQRTRTEVNSFHHQGVARLGDGLVITGRAPDGTVEAVEAMDREFTIGVQWHAETLVHLREQAALFEAFVGATSRRRAGAGRRQVA
jgi:putative glutamine amidotransferase